PSAMGSGAVMEVKASILPFASTASAGRGAEAVRAQTPAISMPTLPPRIGIIGNSGCGSDVVEGLRTPAPPLLVGTEAARRSPRSTGNVGLAPMDGNLN